MVSCNSYGTCLMFGGVAEGNSSLRESKKCVGERNSAAALANSFPVIPSKVEKNPKLQKGASAMATARKKRINMLIPGFCI